MKKITKITSLLLVALMLFSFCSCKKSDNKDNGSDNNLSQIESQEAHIIDFTLGQTIKQSTYSYTEYVLLIPNWKLTKEYFYKTDDSVHHVSESNNGVKNEYDYTEPGENKLYGRLFQCPEDKNLYFVILEYLSSEKMEPRGQAFVDYRNDLSSFSDYSYDFSISCLFNQVTVKNNYYDDDWWSIRGSSLEAFPGRPLTDLAIKETILVTTRDNTFKEYVDERAYLKSATFAKGETQVTFGFFDLTKKHLYQDVIDEQIENVGMSFSYNKLIISDGMFEDINWWQYKRWSAKLFRN